MLPQCEEDYEECSSIWICKDLASRLREQIREEQIQKKKG